MVEKTKYKCKSCGAVFEAENKCGGKHCSCGSNDILTLNGYNKLKNKGTKGSQKKPSTRNTISITI